MEVDSEAAVDSSPREKVVQMENDWKCFCLDPDQPTSSPQNESISRCMVSSFRSTNLLISLSINSGSFTENLAFDSDVLQSLMKILLDGNISLGDKEQVVNLLNKHLQLHPGCCSSLNETYRNFILKPMEELGDVTILEKILQDIENTLLIDDTSCVNNRMSRASRRKKKSDEFVDEEDLQQHENLNTRRSSRRTRSCVEELPDVIEVCEINPYFRFAAFNFIVEIISHEFYSKYYRSENKDAHKKSIAGAIFLHFDDSSVCLNEETVYRILELYHCNLTDDFSRRSLEMVIELISNLCLFADSGSLVVSGDITSSRQYPLSQLFCEYFNQKVFKRASSAELNFILKNVKPDWLRLNCAINALKRSNIKNVSTIIDKINEIFEEVNANAVSENSDPNSPKTSVQVDEKTFKKIFQKKLSENTALSILNLFHSYSVVYDLREFDLNKKRNVISDELNHLHDIYENYCKLKNLVKKITRIENCPDYVMVLLYV